MGTHGRRRGERNENRKRHNRRVETNGGDPERIGDLDPAGSNGSEIRRAGDEARVDILHDHGGHRHGIRHHDRSVLQVLLGVQTGKRKQPGHPKPVAAAENRQSPRYDGELHHCYDTYSFIKHNLDVIFVVAMSYGDHYIT